VTNAVTTESLLFPRVKVVVTWPLAFVVPEELLKVPAVVWKLTVIPDKGLPSLSLTVAVKVTV
jgi:hypothetical protein